MKNVVYMINVFKTRVITQQWAEERIVPTYGIVEGLGTARDQRWGKGVGAEKEPSEVEGGAGD